MVHTLIDENPQWHNMNIIRPIGTKLGKGLRAYDVVHVCDFQVDRTLS